MISVAEESGRLDQELVRIANVTEGDLDRQLKAAVAIEMTQRGWALRAIRIAISPLRRAMR